MNLVNIYNRINNKYIYLHKYLYMYIYIYIDINK